MGPWLTKQVVTRHWGNVLQDLPPEHRSLHGKFVKHTTGVDLREFAPFWALLPLLQCSTHCRHCSKTVICIMIIYHIVAKRQVSGCSGPGGPTPLEEGQFEAHNFRCHACAGLNSQQKTYSDDGKTHLKIAGQRLSRVGKRGPWCYLSTGIRPVVKPVDLPLYGCHHVSGAFSE
jgi:hypothetical protein